MKKIARLTNLGHIRTMEPVQNNRYHFLLLSEERIG